MKSPNGYIPYKAILLMCCADLPACCLLLNMKQYNEIYGDAAIVRNLVSDLWSCLITILTTS